MAQHIIPNIDSSDEEDIVLSPPLLYAEPIWDEEDDVYNELRILHPVFGMVQRIEHVKIHNYVENIVRNYNDIDFIMHFRLSREKTYELINRFRTSEIFISLQDDAGRANITAEKHILCYLWFVGHESASYRDVADRFGVTITEKEETATFYRERKGFPRIIGAIDGSHII
ncbi:hypothetical protein ACS0PU_011178 [Formica fusca]